MHSEDDQIVPYVASGPLSAKLLKNGTLKTYKGFPFGQNKNPPLSGSCQLRRVGPGNTSSAPPKSASNSRRVV
jgi:hypothetical protein